MDKRFFEKKCTYSIRKYAVGACSVLIGALLFGSQLASAAEVEPSNPTTTVSTVADSGENPSGTVEKVEALTELPAELADKLAKAESGENEAPASNNNENTHEAPSDTANPKPDQPAASAETTHPQPAQPEPSAPAKEVVNTPDVNHLLNAQVRASNHEQNTSNTADKAVDGDDSSRWATDRDAVNPHLTLTLEKTTSMILVPFSLATS